MNNITKSALVFVYGNTGTGKTYTIGLLENMDENSEGLIPLSLKHIFSAGCDISISFY
jgi:ABC-type ATPase involved in cell division